MSAINKMVEWLESKIHIDTYDADIAKIHLKEARRLALEEAKEKYGWFIPKEEWEEFRKWKEAKEKPTGGSEAEELESQRWMKIMDKPTAPASLVEELDKLLSGFSERKIFSCGKDEATHDGMMILRARIKEVISRYRPTPTEDIVGVVKELLKKGSECYCHSDGYFGPWPCADCRAREVIRKYSGEK